METGRNKKKKECRCYRREKWEEEGGRGEERGTQEGSNEMWKKRHSKCSAF